MHNGLSLCAKTVILFNNRVHNDVEKLLVMKKMLDFYGIRYGLRFRFYSKGVIFCSTRHPFPGFLLVFHCEKNRPLTSFDNGLRGRRQNETFLMNH